MKFKQIVKGMISRDQKTRILYNDLLRDDYPELWSLINLRPKPQSNTTAIMSGWTTSRDINKVYFGKEFIEEIMNVLDDIDKNYKEDGVPVFSYSPYFGIRYWAKAISKYGINSNIIKTRK